MNKKTARSALLSQFTLIDLFLFIFITSGAVIKIISAYRLPLNAYEAEIISRITSSANTSSISTALVESLFIKINFSLFGVSKFGARIWPVLVSIGISIIPWYLQKEIGKMSAVFISLLLVVDPFMSVNAVQVGSNIYAVLGLLLLLTALWKNNRVLVAIGILVLLMSGRGLLPALIILFGILLLVTWLQGFNVIKKQVARSFLKGKKGNCFLLYLQILPLLISLIIGDLDFAALFSTVSAFFPGSLIPHYRYASIAGLFVLFLSYAPLVISLTAAAVVTFAKKNPKWLYGSLALEGLIFVVLIILPGSNYLDLVWVTLPLIFLSGYYLGIQSKNIKWDMGKTIVFLIFTTLMISTLLSLFRFTFQGISNFSQGQQLINIVTMSLLIIAGFFVLLFLQGGSEYLKGLGIAYLTIMSVIQISFSYRAIGLARNAQTELLWPGSIADVEIIDSVVQEKSQTKININDPLRVGIENRLSPQIDWMLRAYKPITIEKNARGPISVDIAVTQDDVMEWSGWYIGQPFKSDSYPVWIDTPIRSIFDYDYWSWLMFRISEMSELKNVIWIAME